MAHEQAALKSDVITLSDQGKCYQIFLPDNETDYIQKKIRETGAAYELDMLRDMSIWLEPGELVLDVGANIGNHSLYLAAVCDARVVAFEPNAHLARAIASSARLNGLQERIQVHTEGVGEALGTAQFEATIESNLGGQKLIVGSGDLTITTLDAHEFGGPAKLVKIDVEGMEMAVLRGADRLIARDRPLLYIECGSEPDFRMVTGFLRRRKYLFWDTFNATPTHLFVPVESVSPELHLHHLNMREGLKFYRNVAELENVRAALKAANLKYRDVIGQVAKVRDELADSAARAARAEEAVANVREEVAESDARAARAEEALGALRQEQGPPGAVIGTGFVAAWALALPLATEEIAQAWRGLARRLHADNPQQAIALLRTIHEVQPAPAAARALGFALVEAGEAEAALDILGPVVEGLNLSSRENRLMALVRAGYGGADLRARADLAVRSRVRVATIMDEFSAAAFGPECELQQLSIGNWADELEAFRPQVLLIESAWRGLNEEWSAKVRAHGRELQGILAWCRHRGVPTAFWNKEDPVHFDTFLTTAQQFDVIFTTDIDCISRYKAELGHDRVHLLPFACQPEIHNPIEIGKRKSAFCFAGSYYARYPDRTRDLDNFLARLTHYLPFEIFDRSYGKDHPDYMFPESYRHHIVGTLPPTEIDKAYKGYEFGINLNSVKDSQSMFARRVYELLASNTRVISNYSLGLRLMFGDLVISTDSGDEALRRIMEQDESGLTERVRLAGLRKVLSEHTYSHRLASVVRMVGLDLPDSSALPAVTVLALATTREEYERLCEQFSSQSLSSARMVLVTADGLVLEDATPPRVRRINRAQSVLLRLGDLVGPGEWLAGFVAADYYGTHYLHDLVLATRFSDAVALGKAAYHRLGADEIERVEAPVYQQAQALAARRALLRWDLAPETLLDTWLQALPGAVVRQDDMLGLDPFNYCEEGTAGRLPLADVAAVVDDLQDFDTGFPVAWLSARAAVMAPMAETHVGGTFISGTDLAARTPVLPSSKVDWTTRQHDWIVTSHLGDNDHVYLCEEGGRDLGGLTGGQRFTVRGNAGPGLGTKFVAFFLDAGMKRIGHQMLAANRQHLLAPSEGTAFIRFGIRVCGSGSCKVRGIILAERRAREVISRSRVLLLTNQYPSYEHLYRNGFVHSRVQAYRALGGVTPDVYRLRPEHETTWHEFQNIDCVTGSAVQLDSMLAAGQYDHVLVHFLNEVMWEVLQRHIERVRVTVWVHGAEAQPWWRRAFNYTSEEELARAKEASDKRLAFWRGLFAPLPKNLRFIFVSQYFADEVFEDLEITCPPDRYQITHNPIDDQLFQYHEKPVSQRGRILSIRPFASAKYANDLSVKAILALQRRDFFKELEFRLIGDGPLFEEITAPLAGIENVTCEKRFLNRAEIASLHRDYGVFLSPTRMDAQGVSRDEAMSSGLVPVTSRVAAIPEFVDETCGYMAEPDDAEGLARAIVDLWKNPDTFLRKSRAAADRVRRQSGQERVVRQELALFFVRPSEV